MRWTDLLLAVGVASVAASLFTLAATSSRAPEAPTGAVADLRPQTVLKVQKAIDPELVDATPDSTVPRGVLRVAAEGPVRVTGFCTALLFPEDRGEPQFGKWTDVAGAQVGDGIDLRPWFRKSPRHGTHYLHLGIVLESDATSRHVRSVWVRFDPSAFVASGLRVLAPRRCETVVRVRSGFGQAVPGAVVGVEPVSLLPAGVATLFAQTSSSGSLTVSGLEPGQEWVARLLEGLGPHPERVEARFSTAADQVEITVAKMSQRWTFFVHELALPYPGASVRVASVDASVGRLPTTYAVNPWTVPGSGRRAQLWLMCPGEGPPDKLPVRVEFEKWSAPVLIPDVRTPSTITAPAARGDAATVE